MQRRSSKCGITNGYFREMQSRDIGHVQRIGDIQTQSPQTTGTDYGLDRHTKPCRQAEAWLTDKILQAESRMLEKLEEAASQSNYEEPITKNLTHQTTSGSAYHISGKSVAGGMKIPVCLQFSAQIVELLRSAMRKPPITVSTLGELNLTWMMDYVNLRCDINYDHDLHFTPIRGPRGEEKRSQAADYWLALEAELRIYQHRCRECTSCEDLRFGSAEVFQPRLATMFRDLKDLLETLVPDRDHDQLADNLDVDLVTQQVENGVLDTGKMSRWLAQLLMTHCAPMRDESAEAMAEKLENGAKTGDLSTLITGLESLFGFLEAMKLDVANHQIRKFRYALIEETIGFQQMYFRKRVDDGRLNLSAAKTWYHETYQRHILHESIHTKDHDAVCFEAFLHGLVNLCASSPSNQHIPNTLQYDQGRIQQLRADVQDYIVLQLCAGIFNKLLVMLGYRNHVPLLVYATLQSRLLTIAAGDEGQPGFVLWSEKIADVAIEITRAAFVVSSFPHPLKIPAEAFKYTQTRLQEAFEHYYADTEAQLLLQLANETGQCALTFLTMSTVQISDIQRLYQQKRRGQGDLALPDPENMARMLAHMGVIHWQVWREIAYMPVISRPEIALDEIPTKAFG